MADFTTHESAYRGSDVLARFKGADVTVVGCGALGSNLAETLARQGFGVFTLIDDDRVEEHNLGNQAYSRSDIGRMKADALADRLFDVAGVDAQRVTKRLVEKNAKRILAGGSDPSLAADLVIDAVDNSATRRLVQDVARETGVPTLHVGLSENYGEVKWDEKYRVPKDVAGLEVCDYPLARNIVMLTVAVAAEVVADFVATGRRRSFEITLRDLRVMEAE